MNPYILPSLIAIFAPFSAFILTMLFGIITYLVLIPVRITELQAFRISLSVGLFTGLSAFALAFRYVVELWPQS